MVCAGKSFEYKQLFILEVIQCFSEQTIESRFGNFEIILPPDFLMNVRCIHDELIIRGTACIFSGGDPQCPCG